MNQGGGEDEAKQDAEVYGIPWEATAPEEYAVLESNLDVVRAFLSCQTQWRHGPSGHLTGLDYAGARVAVRGLGLSWSKVFERLRAMEGETLRLLATRPERP